MEINIPCGILINSHADFKRKRGCMLGFIRSVYRKFVLVGFWVILIGFTVGGGIIVNAIDGHFIVPGVIGGLITGFIFDILVFGFIVTVLNMDENLEKLIQKEKQNGNFSLSSNKKGVNENANSSTDSIKYSGSIPSPGKDGDEYIVVINTAMRSDPFENAPVIKPLKTDDKVNFQEVM